MRGTPNPLSRSIVHSNPVYRVSPQIVVDLGHGPWARRNALPGQHFRRLFGMF